MLKTSNSWTRWLCLWAKVSLCCPLGLLPVGALHAQLTGQLGAHDPSTVIFDNGKYYYFATGDLLATRSSTNLSAWSGGPAAFNSLPAWIPSTVPGYSGNSLWAPDVIKLNNQYYLYYSASVWGTKLSGIGYATSPTLDPTAPNYGWTDQGKVISSTHSSPYNAIDPSMMLDKNTGKLWMTWGSFNNGIYVKEMNPANGQPLNSSPGVNVGAGPTVEIEGAAMVQRGNYYYMFANWGGCCSGVDSTYNMRVGRSTSPTGPFLDRNGVNMLNGGGTLFLDDDGRKIGPGHFSYVDENGQDKFSYHYYDGDRVGAPTFALRNLYWTSDDWPSAAAVSPNWMGSSGGSWSDTANWTNSTLPNGVGHVANFAAAVSRPATVELPSSRTVGTVNFRGAGGYTINATGGTALTISNVAGESATLNVAEGSHTVNAPIAAVGQLGVNVTPTTSNLTLGGPVTGPGLTKYGYGKVTLAGANSAFSGSIFVKYGTLTVTGSVTTNSFSSIGQVVGETGTLSVQGSGALTSNGDLNIGDTGDNNTPATGTFNISDQASVVIGTAGGLYVGSGFNTNSRAVGTVNQSGGTLTVNRPADGSFVIGGRNSANTSGVYNLSGGTVAANTNVFVGGRGTGSIIQTGGSFTASQYLSVGRFAGSTGNWTIGGGTLNQSNAGAGLFVGEGGAGTLTLQSTGQVNAGGTVQLGNQASGVGTINLDGGVLTARSIVRGGGSATFNFHGGVLRAGTNSGTLMQGLTGANVKAGGARIDSQSFDVTIAQTLSPQPRPQLAVPFAMERAVLQELPDRPHQLLIRHRTERPGPPALDRLRRVAMAVDGRSRHAPDPCHPLQAVDLVRRGRDPPAHRLDLLGAKGRLVSSRSIFASSSSLAIVRSPTFALRRPISASRASAGRVFNDTSPAARKAPLQPLRSAAVTPRWRDSNSRSSPRNSLSTASCLRRADIRRRRSGVDPPPPASWARSDGPTPAPTSSSILHLLAVLYLQSGVSENRRPGDGSEGWTFEFLLPEPNSGGIGCQTIREAQAGRHHWHQKVTDRSAQ